MHIHSSKWLFRAVAKGFSMGTFVLGSVQTPDGKSKRTLLNVECDITWWQKKKKKKKNVECERHPTEMTQRWGSVLQSKKVTAKNVNSCFHSYWNQCTSQKLKEHKGVHAFIFLCFWHTCAFFTHKLSHPCDFYCPWPCLAAWIISH